MSTAGKFWTPDQAEAMRAIEAKLFTVFKSWGYREVLVPVLNDDNNYQAASLRPDLTTAIGKMISRGYLAKRAPLRICSRGTVFRSEREHQQVGVELVGVDSLIADEEVVHLAMECLAAIGTANFTLVLGAPVLVRSMMQQCGLSSDLINQLLAALRAKDLVSYQAQLRCLQQKDESSLLLQTLSHTKTIAEAIEHVEEADAEGSLRFVQLLKRMQQGSCSGQVVVNLGLTGHFDYYTGYVFEIHVSGASQPVISGGRYELAGALSVGMALDLGLVVQAVPSKEALQERWLFFPGGEAATDGFAGACGLRDQGLIVEMDLINKQLSESVKQAAEENYRGVLIRTESGIERIPVLRVGAR